MVKRQKNSIEVDSDGLEMTFLHREGKIIIINLLKTSNKGKYVWKYEGFHQIYQNYKE